LQGDDIRYLPMRKESVYTSFDQFEGSDAIMEKGNPMARKIQLVIKMKLEKGKVNE